MPTLSQPRCSFPALALGVALALLVAACGGGKAVHTPTAEPPVLRVTNATPCVLHIRFDNGAPLARALPGETTEYRDGKLPEYHYMQAESTMAIFRTYDMAKIRADGYAVKIVPAIDDHACVEVPTP